MATKMVRIYSEDVQYLKAVRMFLQKQDGSDKTIADAVYHCIQAAIGVNSVEIMDAYWRVAAEKNGE